MITSRSPLGFRTISRLSVSLSLLLFTGASLSGCSSIGYFFQATRGQMALFQHARPISEVIQDEKVAPRTRKLLAEVHSIKKFGEDSGLKATPNYQEYVKLDRPAAVYVVSACEPLKFRSKEWDFPIVGSFPYLGWFDSGNAKGYAADLKKEGWDVDVRGARAYSTLGWFRDSILSSMIDEGEEALGDLVNVILHESVHATVYVKGQSYFDESLASFVADRLTPIYLRDTRGAESIELSAYLRSEAEQERYQRRLHESYEQLERLYLSSVPDEQKLAEKASILTKLKEELKFRRDINNATLIQHKTYNTGGKEFEGLFKACGSDWRRFLGAVAKLTPESFPKAQEEDLSPVLRKLATDSCR